MGNIPKYLDLTFLWVAPAALLFHPFTYFIFLEWNTQRHMTSWIFYFIFWVQFINHLICDFFHFTSQVPFLPFLQVHRACAEREILEMLDHPFLPALYASFQVRQFYKYKKCSRWIDTHNG